MLLVIPDVLDSRKRSQVRSLLDQGRFIDGRLSAGKTAKRVKHNEELQSGARQMEQLNSLVMGSLVQHPLYQAAVMPYRVIARRVAPWQSLWSGAKLHEIAALRSQ